MAWTDRELRIAKEVDSGTTVAETYTPAASVHEINVLTFQGAAAFSPNSVVKLVWNWDHATEDEEIIWSVKGEHSMPESYPISNCDGIRKLAVVLENGEAGKLVLSGYASLRERT